LYWSAVVNAAFSTLLLVSLPFAKFVLAGFSRIGVIWFSTFLSCFLIFFGGCGFSLSVDFYLVDESSDVYCFSMVLLAGSTPSSPSGTE